MEDPRLAAGERLPEVGSVTGKLLRAKSVQKTTHRRQYRSALQQRLGCEQSVTGQRGRVTAPTPSAAYRPDQLLQLSRAAPRGATRPTQLTSNWSPSPTPATMAGPSAMPTASGGPPTQALPGSAGPGQDQGAKHPSGCPPAPVHPRATQALGTADERAAAEPCGRSVTAILDAMRWKRRPLAARSPSASPGLVTASPPRGRVGDHPEQLETSSSLPRYAGKAPAPAALGRASWWWPTAWSATAIWPTPSGRGPAARAAARCGHASSQTPSRSRQGPLCWPACARQLLAGDALAPACATAFSTMARSASPTAIGHSATRPDRW